MPNSNVWTSAAGELRRLTRRLNAAVARTVRGRSRGSVSGSARSAAPRRALQTHDASPPAPQGRAGQGRAGASGRGMPIQSGVRVGPVGRLLVRIVNHYPRSSSLSVTSGYRPGPRSHHRGLVYKNSPTAAIDIVANGAAGMRDIAKWLYDRVADDTVELIHTTPFASDRGFYVKDQRKYPGGGPYSPQTRREHRDHVHFACSKSLALKILARLDAKAPKAEPKAETVTTRTTGAATRSSAAAGAPGKRRLSKRGAQLIAEFEGLRQKLYNDPAGHCTIGIGHLVHRGRCNGSEPAEFKRGISREQAYALLQRDAQRMEKAVNALGVPLNQNQFDALVSFTYNLGPAWTVQKTGIRDALRAHRYGDVPREMKQWNKADGKVLPGLVRRREAEARLFATNARPRSSARPADGQGHRRAAGPEQCERPRRAEGPRESRSAWTIRPALGTSARARGRRTPAGSASAGSPMTGRTGGPSSSRSRCSAESTASPCVAGRRLRRAGGSPASLDRR